MLNVVLSTIDYHLSQIDESGEMQLSTAIRKNRIPSDNCKEVVVTSVVVWNHILTSHSPASLFLCAVPVGKLTIETTTSYTDTTSAASGKE